MNVIRQLETSKYIMVFLAYADHLKYLIFEKCFYMINTKTFYNFWLGERISYAIDMYVNRKHTQATNKNSYDLKLSYHS